MGSLEEIVGAFNKVHTRLVSVTEHACKGAQCPHCNLDQNISDLTDAIEQLKDFGRKNGFLW